jgi:hypothetical protein
VQNQPFDLEVEVNDSEEIDSEQDDNNDDDEEQVNLAVA